jgi:hypothetical protein
MSETPWKLAGYLVDGLLGRGGSGQVWRAHTAAGEAVALKHIPLLDAEQVRAALAEAALLTTLEHPHLIRVHEVAPTADAVVLVLELAAGGSLAELLSARGRLTPGETITALAPVGAALAYAHAAGVVHGDVTPANVLFTETGFPLLADLGVARLLGDREPVYSTPAYLDPAIAAGCLPAPQTDVFMLGAVALHALTGEAVWPGDGAAAFAAARTGALGDIPGRLAAAGVPHEVAEVVSRALSADPSRRGTAADFALELRYAGDPIAVELGAGRPRREPSSGDRDSEADVDRPGGQHGAVASPGSAVSAVHTHLVAPQPRSERGRRRRTPLPVWQRGYARWGAAVGCAAALAAGAGVAWTQLGDGGAHARAAAPTSAAVGGEFGGPRLAATASSSSASSTATPTSQASSTAPQPLDAAAAVAVLTDLDSLRERAFAQRAPLLLTGVYAPGALLDADTRLLDRLVPSGCGLRGVHTAYGQVAVLQRTPRRTEVSARATLSKSLLVCSGSPRASAAGSGPTTLHITLVAKGSGYVISAISK